MTSYLGDAGPRQSASTGSTADSSGRADRLAIIGVAGFLAYPLSGPIVGDFTLVGLLLVFLAVVGHLTALQRFYYSWIALER